jgi:hypothetical protein
VAKESRRGWSGVKRALGALDEAGLTAVIRDLYDASPDNRRFLHARFLGSDTELEKYRAWQERLDGIVSRSASIGWGYSDATRDIVASLNRGTRR